MENININLGAARVNQNTNFTSANNKQAGANNEVAANNVETKNLSDADVFAFMNGSANIGKASVKMSVNALINKYNSPAAIKRIEEMMGAFESGVVDGLAKFEQELGAVPAYQKLSDGDKLALAAEYVLDK